MGKLPLELWRLRIAHPVLALNNSKAVLDNSFLVVLWRGLRVGFSMPLFGWVANGRQRETTH